MVPLLVFLNEIARPSWVDPKFPGGGGQNCKKMKKIGPKGRTCLKYHYVDHPPLIITSNDRVTGPPGALLFDVKPEIALKESLALELLF